MFNSHYLEQLPEGAVKAVKHVDFTERKDVLSKRLVSDKLTIDGKELPISIVPRILPANYKKIVSDSCRLLTRLYLDSLYDQKIIDSFNGSQLVKILKDEGAYDNLPQVLHGSARFDLAVVGEPNLDNPPKFLEANLLNYAGIGWLPAQKKAFLQTLPQFADVVDYHLVYDDLTSSLYRSFLGMGTRFLMVSDGDWEDYQIFRTEMKRYGMRFDYVDLKEFWQVNLSPDGAVWQDTKYDALYLKCLSDEEEVLEGRVAVTRIMQSKVPVYENLAILPFEDKGRIGYLTEGRMLNDSEKELAAKVLPKNLVLTEDLIRQLKIDPENFVLKNRNAHEGKSVYVGCAMIEPLYTKVENGNTKDWCVQERYSLNSLNANPTQGISGRAIVDLACYVNFVYDSRLPEGKRLVGFEFAAPMSRFSQNSYIVNIKQGGGFVPIFFAKE